MVADIANVGAATGILTSRQTISRVPQTSAVQRIARLSEGVEASQFITSENKPLLSIAEAETGLAIAISSGAGILDALETLRSSLQVSANQGLVAPNTNLLDGNGTRVSRVNFQAQTRILLNQIEDLISSSEYAGANFISDQQSVIRIQTTNFGGQVSINVQPLNPDSLGLTSRDLISDQDLQEFLTQLNEAIILADQRTNRLEEIERAIGSVLTGSESLARAISGGSSGLLPSGSLINLFG